MDADEFRVAAKQLTDYIADYIEGLRDRPVLPDVQPGYINALVPASAPETGEPWEKLFNDIEGVVMRGMTHWHSPRFHAYFPTANSYPAICGDMLSAAIACIGFTWNAAPSCTELEMKMMDWLAQMLALPEHFCFSSGQGGGVIQGTASESTLIALLCARVQLLKERGLQHKVTDADDEGNEAKYEVMSRLVAYTSSQAHSSVQKAAMLSATRIRLLPVDEANGLSLDADVLAKTIEQDRRKGLIPFIVIATLGTTNTCAFDNLQTIGPVCKDKAVFSKQENIWLHVDAAYAGSAFICPEYRQYMEGIEYADSFTMNPHKWLLVNFDVNAFWVKNKELIEKAFNVHPEYLKHENEGKIPDYRHWQIPLGRRFRSLKMWFVFRSYGVSGLQNHIRKQIELAHLFGDLLQKDDRFEMVDQIRMGLVCFRLKGNNAMNEELINSINKSGDIFLTPTKVKERFIIRFAVCARTTNEKDIHYSWNVIKKFADSVLAKWNS
ncbi:PREDICTED: aromatic-L-amino-acid decarboxylase-like [Rhagoletis zephyria]|uniref:aromatic-L-amino-acid decarboxylase-like n=1 Tax=Rhagoletis zephyria TaxID=28612 RepID=UPI0008113912|nr:PREDICTED: aromatic-L-amino-acid decarboxylase-like [Rhagoletis zephyria]